MPEPTPRSTRGPAAEGPWGAPSPPARRRLGTKGRFGLALLISAVLAGVAVVLCNWLWTAIGGAPMTIHGWIALGIALFGAALLTGALMALAFHSDRSGHDDRVETPEAVDERIRRR